MLDLNKYKYELLLLIITLIGGCMRIYHLTDQSLWLDELFTYNVAQLSFVQIWNFTVSTFDVHPTIFYWLEHIALLIFGNTTFALRIFPAIFGTLTIPIFYYIGKELTDSKPFGILMAVIITITTFHIYHSQDARMYALYVFFFSIALYYLIKFYHTNKISHSIIAFLCVALCVYTHFTGLLIGAALILLSLAMRNKNMIYGSITFILACLPVLPTIISVMFLTPGNPFYIEGGRVVAFVGIDAVIRTITYLLGSSSFSIILFLISIVGIFRFFEKNYKLSLFCITFLILSFITIGVLSYKLPLEPRHFIYLLPIIIILIAYGIESMYSMLRNKYQTIPSYMLVSLFALLLLLVNTPMLSFYYTENTKSDYKGLSEKLTYITNDNNIVVLVPGGTQRVFDAYYSTSSDNTRTYYINSIGDFSNVLSTKHTCCSCNKSCIPWRVIVVIASDIKYNPHGEEYQNILTSNNAKHIETYDSFEIYEII